MCEKANPPEVDVSRFKLPRRRRWANLKRKLMFRSVAPVSAATLLSQAGASGSLDGWWNDRLDQSLRRFAASFNRESGADEQGRGLFQIQCRHALGQRDKVEAELRACPEILDEPVHRPMFITGMPRSGTTLLQKLIAQDPERRALLYWETAFPAPAPEPETHDSDPRIAFVEEGLGRMYQAAPQVRALHRLSAKEPEECLGLFDLEFANLSKCAAFNLPSHQSWLLNRDMTPVYAFYKRALQLLAWKFPPRRWVLKAPMHLNYLDALQTVFPDADIVVTHREPLQTLPSTASLVYLFRKLSLGRADAREVGRQTMTRQAVAVKRGMQARAAAPERFLDVSYRALTVEPIAAVRRIYRHFDLDFSNEFESRMQAWLEKNRQHKHGRHRYSLAQFGLDEPTIGRHFSDYREAYRDFL